MSSLIGLNFQFFRGQLLGGWGYEYDTCLTIVRNMPQKTLGALLSFRSMHYY